MSIVRLCWFLMFLVVMGCGDGRVRLPTAAVSGTVTYQGKPLAGGRILFQHPSGQAAAVDIAADGSFKLLAFQGRNQVSVCCYQCDDAPGVILGVPPNKPVKSLIPARYTEAANSGLTLDVKPGEDNEAEFTLKD
jgi:hypothetical protein